MNLKIIVILTIAYLYGIFEFYLSLRQRQKIKIVSKGDKGSLWVLIISITIGYLLSFSIASTKIGRIYHWNIFFAAGLLIIIAGLVIRIISIKTLKQYFSYSVTKVENQEIIEKGLYKYIRHPGYLGQLLIFIGISISLSNWLSIILMFLSTLIGYMNRIRVEENFMVEQMGVKYSDYEKRTKKLIPKIY
ncbi:MAG TPA: isoprenylcysteine carboxylmethyltransferase family protein [Ignavibacteriaceae bacterium]|nr:isoprenylcysteine carboxylmethyltransferase family protein [Ignavibacteriaceae bacterium]